MFDQRAPGCSPCAQLITAPVLPPTPEIALPADVAALVSALPAELVTLDRPWFALEAVSVAVSFALLAVEETASEVDDWARR